MDRFIQKTIDFSSNTGKLNIIKVSKLCQLIENHRYRDDIYRAFNINSILNDFISIDNVGVVFNKIAAIQSNYKFYNIMAESKDISFTRGSSKVNGISEAKPLMFNFAEFVDEDGVINNNLSAYSLYEAKGTFFEEFSMSKFANMLFENDLSDLADYNLNYFKKISASKKDFNKRRRYRVVENENESFVRGITSSKYFEYGVDFTFVVSMLMFHKFMNANPGNNYKITFAALNESKLNMIVSSEELKDAGDFGKVSSAVNISTNDLGKGALNFSSIVKLRLKGTGFYLFPTSKEVAKKDISITHMTGKDKVLHTLSNTDDFYNFIDVFIEELKESKKIKTPNELRNRILTRLVHPKSALRGVKELTDIFRDPIENELSHVAKLLAMCNKAEELEITYDLKEKLRYIISEALLS